MKRLALLLAFFTFGLQVLLAQTKEISGTVTSSEDGSSIPGVSVFVKGTTLGTITNFEGAFNLKVPQNAQTLIFSFVGMKTIEVPITKELKYNVRMESETIGVEEVIVTALGIQKEKKALGYSVGEVSSDLIQNKPEVDIATSLTGKVAGVNVIKSAGIVGSGSSINIRGNSSINGDNQPLFVVDGVPFDASTNQLGTFSTSGGSNNMFSSRFLDLDPNNIESVSVLKGLSAANLYGEQGRNGVIIITTKSGSKSSTKGMKVSVSESVYVNQIAGLPDYQNTYGQGGSNISSNAFVGNWGGRLDEGAMIAHHYDQARFANVFPEYQGVEVEYKAYPNNVKDFFRNGVGTNTYLNISQGFENGNFSANLGYTDEQGYVPGNDVDRINAGFGGMMSKGKFSFSGALNYTRSNYKSPPFAASNAFGAVTIFNRLMFIPRNLDLKGLPYQNPYTGESVYYRTDQENPLWLVDNAGTTNTTNRTYGNVKMDFSFTDKINLSYQLGLDTYTEDVRYFINRGGGQGGSTEGAQGYLRDVVNYNTIWNHNLMLSFDDMNITEDIGVTAQMGLQVRRDIFKRNGIVSQGQLVFGVLQHDNYSSSASYDALTGSFLNSEQEKAEVGVYGQASFDYKNFAYLTVAGRNDWGSTVEKENRSLFYPSVSLSFLPTAAIKSLESTTLNYLKFRAAYATSAGYPPPYNTRSSFVLIPASFDNGSGSRPSAAESSFLGNPNLKPELHKETEVGIESVLFNKRVELEATYYYKISDDQIISKNMDPSTGYYSTYINLGRLDAWGYEVNLSYTPIRTNDLKWKITNIFSASENKVKNLEDRINFNGYSNLGNYAIEGEPLGVIVSDYALRDDEGNYLINGETGALINSDDVGLDNEIIADPNPDWKWNVINTLTYKGFSLMAQVDYTHGGDFYGQTINSMLRRGVTKDTEDREGTWVIPGYIANGNTGELILDENGNKIPNKIQLGLNEIYFLNYVDPSDQNIYDASVIRLREVALSYALSENILKRTPFSSLSVTLSGQNLWYNAPNVPKYTNFDPETLSTGVGNGMGFEFNSAPSSRKFAFTVKASF